MNEIPVLTVYTALTGFALHMALDTVPLIVLAGILSVGFIERGREKGERGRGTAVLFAGLGLALAMPAFMHYGLFSTLVALPTYTPIHNLMLAVIYAAVALPLAFLASKLRRATGWILVAGLICWIPLAAQVVGFAWKGQGSVERIGLLQAADEIEAAAERLNPGALARALQKLRIPSDPAEFDDLLYPTILALLNNSNPEVAKLAAQKIAERGRLDAIPFLLEARPEAAPVVKDAIDAALDTLSSAPEAAPILLEQVVALKGKNRSVVLDLLVKHHQAFLKSKAQELLRTGDEELRGMMTTLIKSGALAVQQDLVAPLIRSLSSADQGERERALASLVDLMTMPGVRERIDPKPLLKILESGSPPAKRAAAALLFEMGSREAMPLFVASANSDDLELVRISLEAILKFGEAKDSAIFAKRVGADNPALRILAYRGLRETLPRNMSLDDPAIIVIQKVAEKETDPAAKRYAVILTAWLDLPNAFEFAESLLTARPTADDKLAAIAAFDLLGEAKAIKRLIELTKDGNPKVRAAAAAALGRIGDKSAEAALRILLSDSVSEVKDAAKNALQELTEPLNPTPTPDGQTPPATAEHHVQPPPGPPPGEVPW